MEQNDQDPGSREVIVVGAGPVVLALGLLPARHRHRVPVLER